MKVLAVTLLLSVFGLVAHAQNTVNRQQQTPAPVQTQEKERRQQPAGENVRQVKKERHSEKCCVRKSEAISPRKKD